MNNKEFVLLVLGISIIIYIILRIGLDRFIRNRTTVLGLTATHFSFLKHSLGLIIVITDLIIIFFHFPELKDYGKGLFASAGILAAILGFASQKAFTNIVSGIFILIYKPFRIGDVIEVDQLKGTVEDITLRHTVIRDYENRRIIIPNSQMSEKTLINNDLEDESLVRKIVFRLEYNVDLDKAMYLIQNYYENHPLQVPLNASTDTPQGVNVRVTNWNESWLEVTVWVKSNNTTESYQLYCDSLRDLYSIFKQNEIHFPFPKIDNYSQINQSI